VLQAFPSCKVVVELIRRKGGMFHLVEADASKIRENDNVFVFIKKSALDYAINAGVSNELCRYQKNEGGHWQYF
jgi:hypothetical protein